MPIKDILVHLDATPQAEVRLDVAADLAQRHGAHVTALFVIDPFPQAMLARTSAHLGDGRDIAGLMQRGAEEARAVAEALEARLDARLRRDGISGEWRLVDGIVAAAVPLHTRYADLVILGQRDPDRRDDGEDARLVEQTLFTSGRPVLVVPYAGRFETLARHVLVAWKPSRESARAVNDALSLMAGAESVTVLTVDAEDDPDHGQEPGADIATHLARHGLPVTTRRAQGGAVGIGDVLLNQAADTGADLLVMGAYGHSRMREMILGGVTRTLLRRMTIPVLMAH